MDKLGARLSAADDVVAGRLILLTCCSCSYTIVVLQPYCSISCSKTIRLMKKKKRNLTVQRQEYGSKSPRSWFLLIR